MMRTPLGGCSYGSFVISVDVKGGKGGQTDLVSIRFHLYFSNHPRHVSSGYSGPKEETKKIRRLCVA